MALQLNSLRHLWFWACAGWLLCTSNSEAWAHSALAAAADGTDESNSLQECISDFDPGVDYYQKLLPPEVINQSFVLPLPLDLQEVDTATGFAVNYGNYYKIVEDQFFNLTYVLYQCGAPRPSPAALGVPAATDTRIFRLPLANVSIDSTISLAFLELLGQLGNLSLTPLASDYVSSSCILQYIADGNVKKIPENSAAANSTEAMFTSASGEPTNGSNAVSFDSTYDGGPLKRAEWIKYLATFLNVEDRAEEIFSYVNTSYQCMNGSMDSTSKKPLIAWLQYYEGVWSSSNATYKLQFDSDAGGLNLDAPTLSMTFNSSDSQDVDAFHEFLTQLDVVVDETGPDNPYSYTLDDFKTNAQLTTTDLSIPIIENQRVWRVDKRLGSNEGYDWFESAIPQPHVVLYDLIGILYPSKGWNQTYFRNIATGEAAVNVSAEACNYAFGTARDVAVITDSEVMACVNGDKEPPSQSSAPSSPKFSTFLFITTCSLLLLAFCGLT